MSLEDLIKAIGIDWTKTFILWEPGSIYECDFDISPTDFLRFANQDLKNKDKRGIINAITNAKRAIDCQVDTLLECIGYSPNTKLPQNVTNYIKQHPLLNESSDVPQRLKLIRTLEAAPANLISKIRGIRHDLEHEYKLPTEAQACEAIELATLFIGALSNVINRFNEGLKISSEGGGFTDADSWKHALYLGFHKGYVEIFDDTRRKDRYRISKTEKQYLELIRLNISISIGGNIDDALYDLLKTINCDIPQNKINVTII
jgi:hypothetical protein